MRQRISYVLPPDPSVQSSPPPYSVDLPHDPPAISSQPEVVSQSEVASQPAISSWPKQSLPAILVSGVLFGEVPVEVECKVSNED